MDRWRAQGGEHADATLVFICHSMGGLIARHYVELGGGADHTRKIITLGTPYRGAASALGQLVNGVRKGIGPLSVDLTLFARSLPSLHQLLPEYACIDTGSGPLLTTTETTVPELETAMVIDAMAFHTELDAAAAARPAAGSARTRSSEPANQPPPRSASATAGPKPSRRIAHATPASPTRTTATPRSPPSVPSPTAWRWTPTSSAASPTTTATSSATGPPSTRCRRPSPPARSSDVIPPPSRSAPGCPTSSCTANHWPSTRTPRATPATACGSPPVTSTA
ncbi:MAG: lipase/acyltransferase domain-containing protein [Pseudonocardia sp.]